MAFDPVSYAMGAKSGGGGGGSGGGVLVVHINEQGVFDKTWQEIFDSDYPVAHISMSEGVKHFAPIVDVEARDSYYYVYLRMYNQTSSGNTMTFLTDSANGYPEYNEG